MAALTEGARVLSHQMSRSLGPRSCSHCVVAPTGPRQAQPLSPRMPGSAARLSRWHPARRSVIMSLTLGQVAMPGFSAVEPE